MDQQRVNLDGFAHEDVGLGLVALRSPHDPEPSLVRRGRPRRRDGRPARPPTSTPSTPSSPRTASTCRSPRRRWRSTTSRSPGMFVDPAVPRAEVVRLVAGTTPAKLARVVALLRPAELTMAMTKLRARRTPSNQAHVTNRLDDPLLLAADAATAAAYGFRELETTVPVLADAPVQRGRRHRRRGGRVAGRPRAVLGRGGDGARDGHPRPRVVRRDGQPLRHRVGVRRRRRHPVQQGDPGRRLRQPRGQDAGLVRRRRRGADGRRRAVLDALPRVALRLAGPRDGRAGRAERRHRRRQRRRRGARAASAS